jgi:hypothetical protein
MVLETTSVAVTTAPPIDSTLPPSTMASSSTSTEVPVSTVPGVDGLRGLVWESAVDPGRVNTDSEQPVFEANGITARIQMILEVDAEATNNTSRDCAREISLTTGGGGAARPTQCLYVQWAFDVPIDFPTSEFSDEGALIPDSVVNPDGIQVNAFGATYAFPGTRDNIANGFFVGGLPGSTLRFDTGSNDVGFTTHVYQVPPGDAFLPVNFS